MKISDEFLEKVKNEIKEKCKKNIFQEISATKKKQLTIIGLQKKSISAIYPAFKKIVNKKSFIDLFNELLDDMIEKGDLIGYETATQFYIKIKE